MAKCNLSIKTKDGDSSLLFKDLVKHSNNPEEAINQYFYTKTAEFKEIFGDWEKGEVDAAMLDIHGEPKYSALSKEAYMFDVDYSEIELESQADVYKKIITLTPEMIDKVDKGIKATKATDGLQTTIDRLENLKEVLQEGEITSSIPKFLEMSGKHVDRMLSRARKEATKKEPNIRKLSRLYKDSQSYSIINSIQQDLVGISGVSDIFDGTIFDSSSRILGNMHSIESLYIEQSKKFLTEEFHGRDSSWSKKDIRKWLDESPRDIKWTEQMLEYAGDSQDRVISMTAQIVMNQEHKTRREAIEFNRDLEEVQEALEKESKTKNAEKMYEDILYERDGEIHLLPMDIEHTDGKNPTQDQLYNKLQQVKATKPALYNFLTFFTDTYGELQASSKTMGTRIPSVLMSTMERAQGKGLKEKYNLIADETKKSIVRSNLDMERGMIMDGTGKPIQKIPTFYTQAYDSADYDVAYEAKYKELRNAGQDIASAIESADTYAIKVASDKMSKLITRDLAHSLQSFHAMARNYANKNEILDVIESAKAVVGSDQRKYTLVDSAGKIVVDKSTLINGEPKPKRIGGKESKAAKYLTNFLNMQVYGQTEKDLGFFDLAGVKLDTNKVLRQLNKKTSWIQMSMNVLASLANIGNGEYNNVMESIGGEYYNVKNVRKASNLYRKDLGNIMKDVGARTPKSLVGQLIEHYNMIQDFEAKGSIKATESTSARRLLTTSLAFFMQNAGEHFMQSRAGLAVLDKTATFDKSGKEIGTLLDAHKLVDGKLIIDSVWVKGKDGELTKFNTSEQNRINNKMNAVGRKLFGNYNKLTANEMKQDARTALVLKYRDWAYEGIVRRYGKKQYYEGLEQEVEGFNRTGARVAWQMVKDLKSLQFSLMKENWVNLTDHEKANVRRAVTEAGFIVALGVAGALLGNMGKMMEDDFGSDSLGDRIALGTFNLLVYEVNRLQTEIAAYVNPVEALRLMQTPAASSSILENVIKLSSQVLFNPTEQYQTGWRKGEYKVGARVEKLIPIYKNVKILNPEGIKDRGVFYNF